MIRMLIQTRQPTTAQALRASLENAPTPAELALRLNFFKLPTLVIDPFNTRRVADPFSAKTLKESLSCGAYERYKTYKKNLMEMFSNFSQETWARTTIIAHTPYTLKLALGRLAHFDSGEKAFLAAANGRVFSSDPEVCERLYRTIDAGIILVCGTFGFDSQVIVEPLHMIAEMRGSEFHIAVNPNFIV